MSVVDTAVFALWQRYGFFVLDQRMTSEMGLMNLVQPYSSQIILMLCFNMAKYCVVGNTLALSESESSFQAFPLVLILDIIDLT